MSNESLLKSGLVITVFCAMMIYHFTNMFAPSGPDTFTIFRISQFAMIGVVIVFAGWTQLVPRLWPWETFIGDKYCGQSSDFKIDPPAEDLTSPHDESFTIRQTLFETTIDGRSNLPGESHAYSTWYGRRFHVQGKTHYFGLIITTPSSTESGVLQLTIENNHVSGFYFSGDPNTRKQCRLTADSVRHRANVSK